MVIWEREFSGSEFLGVDLRFKILAIFFIYKLFESLTLQDFFIHKVLSIFGISTLAVPNNHDFTLFLSLFLEVVLVSNLFFNCKRSVGLFIFDVRFLCFFGLINVLHILLINYLFNFVCSIKVFKIRFSVYFFVINTIPWAGSRIFTR